MLKCSTRGVVGCIFFFSPFTKNTWCETAPLRRPYGARPDVMSYFLVKTRHEIRHPVLLRHGKDEKHLVMTRHAVTGLTSSPPVLTSRLVFQSWCDATSLTTTRNMKWHDMLWFGYKMTLITLLFFFCPVMTLNYSYWLLSVLIWWLLCLVITFLFQDSVFFDIKFMLVVMVSLWLNIWYCLPTTLLWHFFSCLLITQDFFNCLDIFSFVFSNMTLKH